MTLHIRGDDNTTTTTTASEPLIVTKEDHQRLKLMSVVQFFTFCLAAIQRPTHEEL
jgi:hypothetical protein